jgi:hypothetical protein
MTTPQLLPMLRPFALAIAAQRERRPVSDVVARKLDAQAANRAWWISGLTKESIAREAYAEATKAIELGLTKDEFLEQLGGILDKNNGAILSPQRLELIAQNNHAVAYSAGRYAQMRDPELVAKRPFWQYPLGPSDARTSAICKKLEGFIARFDDPAWDHVYPPNHHNERHLQVLTLTEEQARELGVYESVGEMQYPVIDGQTVLPDPGWDMRPDLLGADDAAAGDRAIEISEAALIGAKTPASYGLMPLSSVDVALLSPAPAPIGADWAAFRSLFGVIDQASWYPTPVGGARMNAAVYQQLGDAAGDLAPALKATLDDPFEAWWLYDEEGRTEFRLFGMFAGEVGQPPLRLVARIGADGRLSWAAEQGNDWTAIEAQRTGRLIRSGARSAS